MQAAAMSNLKPVTLELGGKSPFIIFDDVDVDKVVDLALRGTLYNKANSKCSSCLPTLRQFHLDSYLIIISLFNLIRGKSALLVREFLFKKESTVSFSLN